MKNLAIISTDWHIDNGNVGLSIDLMTQQIQLAKEKGVEKLICLGDVFEARKAQPELNLLTFKYMLDMIRKEGMTLCVIAGNHDKVNPCSWDSYLSPFVNHPALELIDKSAIIELDRQVLYFQSFVKEWIWMDELKNQLNNLKGCGKPIYLFSHQSMNGSVNNDGSKVEGCINQQLLLPFEKCFFGHYHDEQQPMPNAYHLGAWKQKNFGENANKGFYVLYEDDKGLLDVEFHKSCFPEYVTLEVNAQDLDVNAIVREKKERGLINLRLKVTGSTDQIKSLPMDRFNAEGIKIKTIDTLEKEIIETNQQIQDYEKAETLIEAFKDFCTGKELNYEEGLEYLKSVL